MLVIKNEKPLIGLTVSFLENNPERRIPTSKAMDYIKEEYIIAVENSGGIPVLIPILSATENIMPMMELFDGIIITGGGDIDPQFYGERANDNSFSIIRKRDEQELCIVREFKRPILGICRGMQLINVAFGGTLIQHLPSELHGTVDHGEPDRITYHNVHINNGSELMRVLGHETIMVNSSHHQGIKKLGIRLVPSAYSYDGLIEAIEGDNGRIIGVQWHPESLAEPHAKGIFEWLIKKCKGGK